MASLLLALLALAAAPRAAQAANASQPLALEASASALIQLDELLFARLRVPPGATRVDAWVWVDTDDATVLAAYDRVPAADDADFSFSVYSGGIHLVDRAPEEAETLYVGVWGNKPLSSERALIGSVDTVGATISLAAEAEWPPDVPSGFARVFVDPGAEALRVTASGCEGLMAAHGRVPSAAYDEPSANGSLVEEAPRFGWWYVGGANCSALNATVEACPSGWVGLAGGCRDAVEALAQFAYPGASPLYRGFSACPAPACVAPVDASLAGAAVEVTGYGSSSDDDDYRIRIRAGGLPTDDVYDLLLEGEGPWVARYPPAGAGDWWVLVEPAGAVVTLEFSPCAGLCGAHGQCRVQSMGGDGLAVAACACEYGWQGAECDARSLSASLYDAQVGLLVASNAFMAPAVWLALRRGLLPEAAAFAANALASALYHACDMDAGCAFALSYETLQDADFALSFMSIVVVVVHLAGFPPAQAGALRVLMLSALMMCAVQDPTSGWNVLFVALSLTALFAGRAAWRRRLPPLRWRLVLLGVALWGAAVAGYAGATTSNYWVVHSCWHAGAMLAAGVFIWSGPGSDSGSGSGAPGAGRAVEVQFSEVS